MNGYELIEKLKKNGFCNAGLIITDNKDREFTIKGITTTLGGCFHSVIELEEIEDPHDKWFRTKEVYLDESQEKLDLYTSNEFREKWIKETKTHDTSTLDKIIDNTKHTMESVKKNYKEGEKL